MRQMAVARFGNMCSGRPTIFFDWLWMCSYWTPLRSNPAPWLLQAHMEMLVRDFSAIQMLDGIECALKIGVIHKADSPALLRLFLVKHLDAQDCPIGRESAYAILLFS